MSARHKALLLAVVVTLCAAAPMPIAAQEVGRKLAAPVPAERGTDSIPLSVKLLNTGRSRDDIVQDSLRVEEQRASERRTSRIASIGLGAALIQTIALIWTLLVMVSSGRREQRAYVSVAWQSISTSQGEPHPGGFQVVINNYGRTPGLRASTSAQMAIVRRDELDSFKFPELLDGDPTGVVVYHPEQPTKLRSHNIEPRLTEDEWARIERGTDAESKELWLCCYGVTRFRDIFNKPHWTRYAFLYGGSFSRDDGSGAAGRPARCHRHNDTSEAPDPTLPVPPRNQPGLDDFGRLLSPASKSKVLAAGA